MSTSVADLVATLRADTSGFTAGMANAGQALQGLNSTGTLSALGAALQNVATIATGAFAGGLATAVQQGLAFDQMIQQSTISFQGLGDSMAMAQQKTQFGVKFSEQFGLDPQATTKSLALLQGLVGGYAATQQTMTALAGAAATAQQPIQQVTDQVATLANVMANNPIMGQWQGIALAKQNIESYAGVMKAHAEAVGGASQQQIFDTLISGLNGGAGAASEFSKTLTGVKTSLTTEFKQAAGEAFQPLYDDLVKAGQALAALGNSTAAKELITQISGEVQKLGPSVDALIQHIQGLATSGGASQLLKDLKDAVPLLAVVGGFGASGAAKHLPGVGGIVGDIGGPVAAIGSLMATTSQGRQQMADLAKEIAGIGTAILPAVEGLARFVAELLKFAPLVDVIVTGAAAFKGYEILKDIKAWAEGAALSLKNMAMSGGPSFHTNTSTETAGGGAASKAVAEAQSLQAASAEALTSAPQRLNEAELNLVATQDRVKQIMLQTTDASASAAASANLLTEAETRVTEASLAEVAAQRELASSLAVTKDAEMVLSEQTSVMAGLMSLISNPLLLLGGALTVATTGWMMYSQATQNAQSAAAKSVQGITDQTAALTTLNAQYEKVKNYNNSSIDFNPISAFQHEISAFEAPAKAKGVSQEITAYEGQASQSNVSTFNTQNPAGSGDVAAMATRLSAAKSQIAALQSSADQSPNNSPNTLSGEKYQIEIQTIKALSAATTQWGTEYKNATDIINAASKITGQTFTQTAANAKQFGIDLTQALSTNAGGQALQALVGDVQQAGAAVNESIGQMTAQLTQFDLIAQGKTGARKFTVDPKMMNQLGQDASQLKAQGLDSTNVTNDQALLKPYEGQTLYSVQYIDQLVRANTIKNQAIDLNHQLAQAEFQVTQAAFAVTDAQNNVTKSAWSEADAQFSLAQAYFQQERATVQYNAALANQAGAQAAVKDSLKGFTDTYWNLNSAVGQLKSQDQAWGAQLLQEVSTLQTVQNQYTLLNNQYTNANNQLQMLTDTEKRYQDILARPLAGQNPQAIGIQQNLMAQDQLKTQINQLELEGVNSQSLQIINLQNQLDVLSKIGDQLNLQNQMTVGNEQFKLNQAQQLPPISYATALSAAEAMGKLNLQVANEQAAVDKLKPAVDAINIVITKLKQVLDPQITALQNSASANQALINAYNGTVTAAHAVVTSTQGVQQAVWSAIDAQHSLSAAENSYQNALFSVDSAQRQITANTLSNYQQMSQAVESYVADALNALKNLQAGAATTTTDLNAMTLAAQQAAAAAVAVNAQTALTQAGGSGPSGTYAPGAAPGGPAPSGGNTFMQQWIDQLYGVVPGHAAGGLISQDSLYRGAEGNKPELVLPMSNPSRSMSLLSSYAPSLMGAMSGMNGTSGQSINIEQGAVSVSITGIPGADEVAGEVQAAIEGALTQILQAVG